MDLLAKIGVLDGTARAQRASGNVLFEKEASSLGEQNKCHEIYSAYFSFLA